MQQHPTDTRFAFGKNWQSFRERALNDERVAESRRGLERLLDLAQINGKSFLDIGSGSGLHSLAAFQMGASPLVSFDYDPDSVACTEALRRDRAPEAGERWRVLRGSAIDETFMRSLGTFDVVYSWGVLHHTGDMWRGIRNAMKAVNPGGALVLALYNRVEGSLGTLSSDSWRVIKKTYVEGSPLRQRAMLGAYTAWRMGVAVSHRQHPLHEMRSYDPSRGMNWFHDARDWLGGYPYEYATVDEVTRFVERDAFTRTKVEAVHPQGWGNNEFVFTRATEGATR